MAIKLDMQNGEVIVYQKAFSPTVYLDTWAYNIFALNAELSDKFIKILNEKNGTLLISDLNLFEICKAEDKTRFELILKIIKQLDQAFIDTTPRYVIDREQSAIYNKLYQFISPATPIERLYSFVKDPSVNTLKPFNLVDGFKIVRANPSAIKIFMENLNFEKEIIPQIEIDRNNPIFVEKARINFKNRYRINKKSFPHTSDIYRQFIEFITINKTMKMPNSEWIDAFHTIVPTAYSDFILLDNRWVAFINQTKLKPPSIAKVYNKRNLNKFFIDLQDFDSTKKRIIIKNLIEDKQ